MARTKTRRPRATRARSVRGFPDLHTFWRAMTRPELVGTLLVVVAVAAIAYLVPPLARLLPEARDRSVEALGLHAFTTAVIVAAIGLVLAARRQHWLVRHRRHLAGLAAALVFLAGILGRWYPITRVGGVDLSVHSAGGDAARLLTTGGVGPLVWIAAFLAAFALLWPRTTARLARATPGRVGYALAWLWALGLHRSLGRGLLAGGRGAGRLIARSRGEREHRPTIEDEIEAMLAGQAAPASAEPPPEIAPAVAITEPESDIEHAAEPATSGRGRRRKASQLPMDLETPAGALRHSADGWQIPPINILKLIPPGKGSAVDNARRAKLITETLASFGVDASVVQVNEGPTVTQFGVEPGWDVKTRTVVERDAAGQAILGDDGQPRTKEIEVSRTRIRVNRITALQNDLALALATPALRIEAPVPGKPMVGIEVPNQTTALVPLRSVMESVDYSKALKSGGIPIALGAGVSGDPVVADLATMPHLLIAGATGSGKSVCLNALITCLLMNFSPEELRLVMIDPKRVELTGFANIPHLAFSEIVVEMDQVVGTLQAVINEMESRYRRFAKAGVRNIKRYNETTTEGKLPFWVVIIDELADLMLVAPYQVENQLVRLAQLARATGIHLVVATQRPSVDVITGLIKANFPTRIAFAVSSMVDSRTILDHGGAEKLLGKGDMLYVPPDAQKPRRVQGAFVADQEIDELVKFWSSDRFAELVPEKFDELLEEAQREVAELSEHASAPGDDPMVSRAIEVAREHQSISTSLLQRKLRIGYPRAARLMDELEERGYVGSQGPGGGSREVLMASEPGAEPESLAAAAASFEPPSPSGGRPPSFPRAFDSD